MELWMATARELRPDPRYSISAIAAINEWF
jgi:hypothetical protein